MISFWFNCFVPSSPFLSLVGHWELTYRVPLEIPQCHRRLQLQLQHSELEGILAESGGVAAMWRAFCWQVLRFLSPSPSVPLNLLQWPSNKVQCSYVKVFQIVVVSILILLLMCLFRVCLENVITTNFERRPGGICLLSTIMLSFATVVQICCSYCL